MKSEVALTNREWPMVRLDDACSLITDGTHQTPTYADEGFVFLSSKNVVSGKIDWENVKRVPEWLHTELHGRLSPQKGDLLLAKNGTTGVAAVVDRDVVFDIYVSLALLRPKSNVLPEYLHRALNSPLAKRQFNGSLKGIGVPNLHLKDIRRAVIPLPPLEEQRRIAGILDRADDLRAKRRAAVAQLDELTQAIFIDMFGDPSRNSRHFRMIPLGALGDWASGGTPPRSRTDYFEGPIPWFSSGELNEMYVVDSEEHLSNSAIAETAAKRVPSGALMLGMYDTAALKASIATIDCSCNQAIAFATINPSLAETLYVYFAIVIGREHFRRLQRGVRQKNLNLSMIREIEIFHYQVYLCNANSLAASLR